MRVGPEAIDGSIRPTRTPMGSPGGPEGHSRSFFADAGTDIGAMTDPSSGGEAYMKVVNDGSMTEELRLMALSLRAEVGDEIATAFVLFIICRGV